MSADELQRIFKTLSDPTRVRLLSLLEREELAVQELMEVLGMAQSRVSRHLAILRDAGLVRDRRDGTYVFYHLELPEVGPWREVWQLVRRGLSKDTTADRDSAALSRALEARADRARSFFDAVGPEWDALRKVFDDDALRAHALDRRRLTARDVQRRDHPAGVRKAVRRQRRRRQEARRQGQGCS